MSNVPPPPPQDPNQQPPQGGAPQPGQYQQQPGQYQQAPQYQQPYAPVPSPDNGFSNLQLNLWLSVFFGWITGLIFWLVDKDKTTDPVRRANGDNFSFQLLRLIVLVVGYVLLIIPFIGALLYFLLAVAFFVIAIVNAVQVPKAIREGQEPKVILNVNWIK